MPLFPTNREVLAGALSLVMIPMIGCREPNQMTTATPLGVQTAPKLPEGLEAAVVGESGVASAGYVPDDKAKKLAKEPLPDKPIGEPVTTESGLKYAVYTAGTGAEAKPGQTVSVHYTGTFTDGKPFDSSRERDTPYTFKLGTGSVIKGWDEGIAGMKIGERRVFTIPPALAYGASGKDTIPPNTTLMFDVILLDAR